jgi:hypothetical protein
MVLDDPTEGSYEKISTGLQAGTVTADVVVQDFMILAEGSALEDCFCKNLVRHICGYEEGLLVLARGVLSDYRWLLAVTSRQLLSLAASQYVTVVYRGLE